VFIKQCTRFSHVLPQKFLAVHTQLHLVLKKKPVLNFFFGAFYPFYKGLHLTQQDQVMKAKVKPGDNLMD
jgi:hypothetical protein